MSEKMQKENLSQPDATRSFDKGRVELVTLGGVTFGRATLQHLQYHVSGRLHIVMDDGTKSEFGPGDVSLLPPGYDAWVVGNEPVVVIDI
jgi:hypothetical protein